MGQILSLSGQIVDQSQAPILSPTYGNIPKETIESAAKKADEQKQTQAKTQTTSPLDTLNNNQLLSLSGGIVKQEDAPILSYRADMQQVMATRGVEPTPEIMAGYYTDRGFRETRAEQVARGAIGTDVSYRNGVQSPLFYERTKAAPSQPKITKTEEGDIYYLYASLDEGQSPQAIATAGASLIPPTKSQAQEMPDNMAKVKVGDFFMVKKGEEITGNEKRTPFEIGVSKPFAKSEGFVPSTFFASNAFKGSITSSATGEAFNPFGMGEAKDFTTVRTDNKFDSGFKTIKGNTEFRREASNAIWSLSVAGINVALGTTTPYGQKSLTSPFGNYKPFAIVKEAQPTKLAFETTVGVSASFVSGTWEAAYMLSPLGLGEVVGNLGRDKQVTYEYAILGATTALFGFRGSKINIAEGETSSYGFAQKIKSEFVPSRTGNVVGDTTLKTSSGVIFSEGNIVTSIADSNYKIFTTPAKARMVYSGDVIPSELSPKIPGLVSGVDFSYTGEVRAYGFGKNVEFGTSPQRFASFPFEGQQQVYIGKSTATEGKLLFPQYSYDAGNIQKGFFNLGAVRVEDVSMPFSRLKLSSGQMGERGVMLYGELYSERFSKTSDVKIFNRDFKDLGVFSLKGEQGGGQALAYQEAYITGYKTGTRTEYRTIMKTVVKEDYISLVSPTQMPVQIPTQVPTQIPFRIAFQVPTQIPTQMPVQIPTQVPKQIPKQFPTQIPTQIPLKFPISIPKQIPKQFPTQIPTQVPKQIPIQFPTQIPTQVPTQMPVQIPVGIPFEPPYEPPYTPLGGSGLWLDLSGGFTYGKKSKKGKGAYRPSFIATTLGIKTSRAEALKAERTGVGIRGLVGNVKRN